MSGPTPRPDMIESMERVLSHIGECAGVKVGDVPALLAWAEECKEVKRQRDALLAALKGCDAYQRASLYERCPDCDYPGRCSRETGCLVCERKPLPHIVVARAAIKEAEGSL